MTQINHVAEYQSRKIADVCSSVMTFFKYIIVPRTKYKHHVVPELNLPVVKYVLEEMYDCQKLTQFDITTSAVDAKLYADIEVCLKSKTKYEFTTNPHAIQYIACYITSSIAAIAGHNLKERIRSEYNLSLVKEIKNRRHHFASALARLQETYVLNPEEYKTRVAELRVKQQAIKAEITTSTDTDVKKALKRDFRALGNCVNMRKEMSNIITQQIKSAQNKFDDETARMNRLDMRIAQLKSNQSQSVENISQLDETVQEHDSVVQVSETIKNLILDLQQARKNIRDNLQQFVNVVNNENLDLVEKEIAEPNMDEYFQDVSLVADEEDQVYQQVKENVPLVNQFDSQLEYNQSRKDKIQRATNFRPVFADEIQRNLLISQQYQDKKDEITKKFQVIIDRLASETTISDRVMEEYNTEFAVRLQHFQDLVSHREIEGSKKIHDLSLKAIAYISIGLCDWFDQAEVTETEVYASFDILVPGNSICRMKSEKYGIKNSFTKKFTTEVQEQNMVVKIYNNTTLIEIEEYINSLDTKSEEYIKFANRVRFFAHKLIN